MPDTDDIDREKLLAMLDEAKAEQQRCMGGVDPAGCISASKTITTLRLRLQDNAALFAHFQRVMDEPPRPKRGKRVQQRA